jgi:single-strand DNA-binding protein
MKNSVELIGYLGADGQLKSSDNGNFTLLSLATKETWKDKASGEYASRTEWHSVLASGKLGDYAATLTKGAFVLVEGTLRSRDYTVEIKGSTSKKPQSKTVKTWHIRASSIRRLDRKADPAQEHEAIQDPAADAENESFSEEAPQ